MNMKPTHHNVNIPNRYLKNSAFNGIVGIILISLIVTSICWLLIVSAKNMARYDCYVWGFNNAICRYGQFLSKYSGYGRCPNHLKPVELCEEFPETEKGVSDARRFIRGDPIDTPPSNRDYRTFHVNW